MAIRLASSWKSEAGGSARSVSRPGDGEGAAIAFVGSVSAAATATAAISKRGTALRSGRGRRSRVRGVAGLRDRTPLLPIPPQCAIAGSLRGGRHLVGSVTPRLTVPPVVAVGGHLDATGYAGRRAGGGHPGSPAIPDDAGGDKDQNGSHAKGEQPAQGV